MGYLFGEVSITRRHYLAVSNAFDDVYIHPKSRTTTTDDRLLECILNTTYPSRSYQQSHHIMSDEIPPLLSLHSGTDTLESLLPTIHHPQPITPGAASLPEEISEAFSDVDISFGQENTVTVRRNQLEHLSSSWVDNSRTNETGKKSSSAIGTPKNKNSDFACKLRGSLKKVEPPIRLKGNRSISQKFANLVNAFE